VTGNWRPEAEQPVASAENGRRQPPTQSGAEVAATLLAASSSPLAPEGAGTTPLPDLEKGGGVRQCARDNGMKDVPDTTSDGPLVDMSRIPSAAGRGARSISGFQAAADTCTAIDSGELAR
jgi:hypothetical protein